MEERDIRATEEKGTDVFYKKVLRLAIQLGYGLHSNGAETYRVEDSCVHLLNAYQCKNVEVFALANNLSITFTDKEERDYFAQKRLPAVSNNFRKLDLLNKASRSICEELPNPDIALNNVAEIMATKSYPFWAQVLSCGLIGFGFTLMIGGSWRAAIYAFGIDVLLRLLLEPLFRLQANRMFINIIGGMIVTFLAWPGHNLNLESELNLIVSGSFMYLFPGVSLMNSVRDIIASDYLAGFTKLLETLLVALAIAIGSGIALTILGQFS